MARSRPGFRRSATENETTLTSVPMTSIPPRTSPDEKTGTEDAITTQIAPEDELEKEHPRKDLVPTEDAQRGVQQVKAIALTWSRIYLISVFILFVLALPLPNR